MNALKLMKDTKDALIDSQNKMANVPFLLLFGLMSLLIFAHYYNNSAFGQKGDELYQEFKFISDNIIANISKGDSLLADQNSLFQKPPSGFVAKGTINTVISVPAGKWLASGNWSMVLNNGNVTFFVTNMTWYNSSGTTAHSHELANFRPVDSEEVLSVEHPHNNIIIKGATDVGTNGKISWIGVPTTVSFNARKIVNISVDDNKTNHHFAGQPIMGIVSSFMPCSDLPGSNMEILPACSATTSENNGYSNTRPPYPSNEGIPPYQSGLGAEKSVPSNETQNTEKELPYEDSQVTEQSVPYNETQNTEKELPYEDSQVTEQSVPSKVVPPYQAGPGIEEELPYEESQRTNQSFKAENAQQCREFSITNVSASGFEADPSDYHPPSDAIDGNSSTWWSNQDKNSWLKLDLGGTKMICGLSIEWNKGDTRKYSFDVGVSEDGNDFLKVFEGSNKVGSSTPETYSIDPVKSHYVKVAITGTSSDIGWASIREINVIGRPSP